jgi:protein-disulfide isomerase
MEEKKTEETKKKDYLLPASILLSALLISASLVYNVGKRADGTANLAPTPDNSNLAEAIKLRAVDKNDHIFGNPNAPVKVVEFSDLECPFCKRFHPTMKQVLSVYGDRVAWVYRHFPLDTLHPKARKEAEAAECAAALGGNEAFWNYTDRIFETTPSNNGLDLALLPKIAEELGISRNQFDQCLNDGRYADRVQKDFDDGLAAGVRGTPTSFVIDKKGKKYLINGALPYEQVKTIIDEALRG